MIHNVYHYDTHCFLKTVTELMNCNTMIFHDMVEHVSCVSSDKKCKFNVFLILSYSFTNTERSIDVLWMVSSHFHLTGSGHFLYKTLNFTHSSLVPSYSKVSRLSNQAQDS